MYSLFTDLKLNENIDVEYVFCLLFFFFFVKWKIYSDISYSKQNPKIVFFEID